MQIEKDGTCMCIVVLRLAIIFLSLDLLSRPLSYLLSQFRVSAETHGLVISMVRLHTKQPRMPSNTDYRQCLFQSEDNIYLLRILGPVQHLICPCHYGDLDLPEEDSSKPLQSYCPSSKITSKTRVWN